MKFNVLPSSSPPYPPQGGTDPFINLTTGKSIKYKPLFFGFFRPFPPTTTMSPLEGGREVKTLWKHIYTLNSYSRTNR